MAIDNPLRALQMFGQSVWLDYIRRSLITSGELRRLIDEDGLRGVTSNPAIFEKAIARKLRLRGALERRDARSLDAKALYETARHPRHPGRRRSAAPGLRRDVGRDGYVSLEVSPLLAARHRGHARRSAAVCGAPCDRDNVMIKVPATPEGIPAIEQLIGEGINVNVTLLFAQRPTSRSPKPTSRVWRALAARGGDLTRVASVASFFISRIDTAVDALARRAHARRRRRREQSAASRPDRQGRDRQRQADLPALSGALQRPALGGAGAPGRANAAPALGQHRHEESRLSRRDLRRGADRPGHRQHDSAGDLRRVSRSRAAAREPARRMSKPRSTRWRRSSEPASP